MGDLRGVRVGRDQPSSLSSDTRTVRPSFGGVVNHTRTWRYFVVPLPRATTCLPPPAGPTSGMSFRCAQRGSRASGGSSSLSVGDSSPLEPGVLVVRSSSRMPRSLPRSTTRPAPIVPEPAATVTGKDVPGSPSIALAASPAAVSREYGSYSAVAPSASLIGAGAVSAGVVEVRGVPLVSVDVPDVLPDEPVLPELVEPLLEDPEEPVLPVEPLAGDEEGVDDGAGVAGVLPASGSAPLPAAGGGVVSVGAGVGVLALGSAGAGAGVEAGGVAVLGTWASCVGVGWAGESWLSAA